MMYPQRNEMHEVIDLDGFWSFYADRDGNADEKRLSSGLSEKRVMAVPASWNDQYEDLFHFFGKGWYEKKVFIPSSWEGLDIYLRFGSVSGKAAAWVNGEEVIRHEGSALPFECNIAGNVRFGEENTVVVLADNTLDPWGLPPATLEENEGRIGFSSSFPAVTYDFFPYGGIHRSVKLYTANKIRIEDITVKTDIDGADGIVSFEITLNQAVTGSVEVSTGGKTICCDINGSNKARGVIRVENAQLWDVGKPNLYHLNISLFADGRTVDIYDQEYGIRSVEVKGEKLYLNGRPVFLKGFGKHEDFYVIGKGFSPSVAVKDFGLMEWCGANSFRTSHYPYDEQILQLADRKGFLVIDETPFVGLNNRNYREDILKKAKGVIKEMIDRDKNHPSVIMWSLANEPNISTDEAENFFREMAECARSLDSTRPITYVAHLEPEDNRAAVYFDIICVNKYYGWYYYPGQIDGSLEEFSDCLDRFYDKFKKGIILTEFGADAVAGMHTNPPQMFSEEYQSEIIEKQYRVLTSKPYAVGAHVWAFADFKTAQTISRIIFNRKGVFTREREPKMAAHTLRKLWHGDKIYEI